MPHRVYTQDLSQQLVGGGDAIYEDLSELADTASSSSSASSSQASKPGDCRVSAAAVQLVPKEATLAIRQLTAFLQKELHSFIHCYTCSSST